MKTQCPLKDRRHKIWLCEKFKKMKKVEGDQAVRYCNLCFSCLGCGQRIEHNVQRIELVTKMDTVSVITFLYIPMRRNPTAKRKATAKMRLLTMRMQCSQQTSVVGVYKMFQSPCRAGALQLRKWLYLTPDLHSHLWTRTSGSNWLSQGPQSHSILLESKGQNIRPARK